VEKAATKVLFACKQHGDRSPADGDFCVQCDRLVCSQGARNCLTKGHAVLSKEQSEALLKRRLEHMEATWRQMESKETAQVLQFDQQIQQLRQQIESFEQRKAASQQKLQRALLVVSSTARMLNPRECDLSAEVIPFMATLQAFEAEYGGLVLRSQPC
jgi:hypothetical protein